MLYIDIGNSTIKWAIREADGWCLLARLGLSDSPDKLLADIEQLQPSGIVVACQGESPWLEQLRRWKSSQRQYHLQRLVTDEQFAGLRNGYSNPGALGVDRWLAMIGASSGGRFPCLVIDSGTALTIDAVDGAGQHLGGLILPGVDMMRRALASDTRSLPLIDGERGEQWGRNTEEAIATGVFSAHVGAIQDSLARLTAACDGQAPQVFVTGGAGQALIGALAVGERWSPHLVFDGMYQVISRNCSA